MRAVEGRLKTVFGTFGTFYTPFSKEEERRHKVLKKGCKRCHFSF
jgi:hypothetical protein